MLLSLVVSVNENPDMEEPSIAGCLRVNGWEEGGDGISMRKNGVIWATHDDGSSLITSPDGSVVTFTDNVRTVVVVAACMATAASV